jgi:ketosteroid isomerase-like protein
MNRPWARWPSLALLVLAGCAAGGGNGSAEAARAEVASRVDALLAAYAAGDPQRVMALVDTRGIVVFGSDVAERAVGPAQVRRMMADDFRLWGSARFGRPDAMDVRVDGMLASAFFNVPFAADGGPERIVRMATVWHKVGGRWLLTQASSTVPTTGSSASELLRRAQPQAPRG